MTRPLTPPAPFTPPGPGAWLLDRSHCERPQARWIQAALERSFDAGFRASFAEWGVLLDTIETRFVNGFCYQAMRAVGAPPSATSQPPWWLFKLSTWLHPETRRRIKRSGERVESRHWRVDADRYETEWFPALEAEYDQLRAVEAAALGDAELADHIAAMEGFCERSSFVHHRVAMACIFPVGDLLQHAAAWGDLEPHEVLPVLASRESVGVVDAVDRLAAALRAEDAEQWLRGHPAAVVERLRSHDGAIGIAARAWLDEAGPCLLGFSLSDLTAGELPDRLVASIREALSGPRDRVDRGAARQAILARLPEDRRAPFEALIDEAEHVHWIRDHRALFDGKILGLARCVLLEAGGRLVEAGRLQAVDHALDLTTDELRALLAGDQASTAMEVADCARYRQNATQRDAPLHLRAPWPEPPPTEWLPAGPARRVQGAVMAYVRRMLDDAEAPHAEASLSGHAASGGVVRGPARLVLSPQDFGHVQPGDILVARLTSPSYNVLLPLLAGIVTDRGGVLSHPAIVSREFGWTATRAS